MDVYFIRIYCSILYLSMCFTLQKGAAISHKLQQRYERRIWPAANRADFVDPEDEWWRYLTEIQKTNRDKAGGSSRKRREIASEYTDNAIASDELQREYKNLESLAGKTESGQAKISRPPGSGRRIPVKVLSGSIDKAGGEKVSSEDSSGSQGEQTGSGVTSGGGGGEPCGCCQCRGSCECPSGGCNCGGASKCPGNCPNPSKSRCGGGSGGGGCGGSGGGDRGGRGDKGGGSAGGGDGGATDGDISGTAKSKAILLVVKAAPSRGSDPADSLSSAGAGAHPAARPVLLPARSGAAPAEVLNLPVEVSVGSQPVLVAVKEEMAEARYAPLQGKDPERTQDAASDDAVDVAGILEMEGS